MSDYRDFEQFYNYLPYVIAKPVFILLRLTNCKLPVNSVKSITSTFLSRATDHNQSLEFIDCEVVEKCGDTYSKAYPLINEAACVFVGSFNPFVLALICCSFLFNGSFNIQNYG